MNITKALLLLAALASVSSCLFELKYAIGGTVVGLHGTGLVLQDDSDSDLRVDASGSFTFGIRLAKGKTYAVTVKTQPSNPAQTCAVRNGSGTIAKQNVSDVIVTCTQPGRYAYVANETANTLSAYVIDSASGMLTPLANSPYPSIGNAPAGLALDPNGGFLYAANSGSNSVSVYAIDDATGALRAAGFIIPTGSVPAALTLDPTGRYLYVANSSANTVSAYAVHNGIATAIAGSPYAVGTQPVALQTDPGGFYLYVTNFADGSVSAFAIDSATGQLTTVSGTPFGTGAGATSLAVDPSGTFVYVANQNAATLSAFSLTAGTGVLGTVSGSPLATGSHPEAVVVNPAGTQVFAANVTSANTIATYAITPSSGALTLSSTSGAGLLPVSLAVDPSGLYLYAANQASGSISVFGVDAATGALAAVAKSPFAAGAGARSIVVD